MKTIRNITRCIRNFHVSADEAFDQRIRGDIQKMIRAGRKDSSSDSFCVWRFVPAGRWARYSVAAVLGIAVAVVLYVTVLYNSETDSTGLSVSTSQGNGLNSYSIKQVDARELFKNTFNKYTDTDSGMLRSKAESRSRALFSIDKQRLEAETATIQALVSVGDVEGLIEMLTNGYFPSKVTAAEHLGEIGDERALPELIRLNESNGGWRLYSLRKTSTRTRRISNRVSGAFAVAICKIKTRTLPEPEQIEALFDLLEGRGPAVPTEEEIGRPSYDVGWRVAVELDRFDDPAIPGRLRQSENRGAAIIAVWMETRDLSVENGIFRCLQIARDEGGAQRYAAIHVLDSYGEAAIEALNLLANDGHGEAINVLGYQKEKQDVLDLICGHLILNTNSHVRWAALLQLHGGQSARPNVVPTLIRALYDPRELYRREAARILCYAAAQKITPHLEELELAMLIALKHPDDDIRDLALKALENLGSTRIGEAVADSPPLRTDLEVNSKLPLTLEQRLKPFEAEAAKRLQLGPVEDALELYTELLEQRPAYEPYVNGLEKARAYVQAAVDTDEPWYPDAPYIGLKGRYSYFLAREPTDLRTLKEEFDLAMMLSSDYFEGWTSIFGQDPKGKDQLFKALKLFEHIVASYPENEYLAIRAKAEAAGLQLNLHKDVKAYVSAYTDIFAIAVDEVVDSTVERRNIPLKDAGGKSQAQLDFERHYKDHSRARVIELCTSRQEPLRRSLLDTIIQRCSQTDAELVEMAKAARSEAGNRN